MTANPNASPETKKLLTWLTALPDRPARRVLVGQRAGGWSFAVGYETYIEALHTETGKYPALLGADYALNDWSLEGQNSRLIEYWNAGGLVTISWHADNPWTGGEESDRTILGDFGDAYTPGTAAYAAWRELMDVRAGWLAELRDAGVAVLWRPFHEMNAEWTWWGGRDREKFVNLWRDMFDYFTLEKGLDNLLWVYAPNRGPVTHSADYYYPGDGCVDVVGLDFYVTNTWQLSGIDDIGWTELKALGKPMALTEFGPTGWLCGVDELEPPPDCYDYGGLMDEVRAWCPEAVYFMPWWMNWAIVNQNGAQELMDDAWAITREEIDWRTEMEEDVRSIKDVTDELNAALAVLNASATAAQVAMAEMQARNTDLQAQTDIVSALSAELQDLLTG